MLDYGMPLPVDRSVAALLLSSLLVCGCNRAQEIGAQHAPRSAKSSFQNVLFQGTNPKARIDTLTAAAAKSMIEASPNHTGKTQAKLVGTEKSVACGRSAGWWTPT